MKRISHRNHVTKDIPQPLAELITRRFNQLTEDSDGESIPIIILVETGDSITGPDYAFIGNRGLLTDSYEEAEPLDPAFIRPYEWCSYWPDLGVYELLYLQDPDNGYWLLIPDVVVETHPELKWVLTDESQAGGLSEPLALY